jgi:hypothetical protein
MAEVMSGQQSVRLEENQAHALAQVQAICERKTRPGPRPTKGGSGS